MKKDVRRDPEVEEFFKQRSKSTGAFHHADHGRADYYTSVYVKNAYRNATCA